MTNSTRVTALALLSITAASPGLATEHEIATYGPILESCYAAATETDAKRACIGAMSTACMDTEEGGQTTLGMTYCLSAEADVWDKFLNAEYKSTIAAYRAMDEDEAVYFPEFAKRVDSLREAQRAWIPFRDAECGLAYAQWGSGSMRNIAYADCRMQMTAERVLDILDMGSDMR